MPNGDDGRTEARRAAYARAVARRRRARAAARRRARRARLLALVLVILPSVLILAAPVQASMSPAEREAQHATKLAERAARHEASKALQLAKKEAAQRAHAERWEVNHPNANVVATCDQLTVSYKAFPDTPGNTVGQMLTINHDHSTRQFSQFVFDGPTGTAIIPLDGHAGRYQVDLWARFTINGAQLHFDNYHKVVCPPAPAITIEKLQRIAGGDPTFTPTTLTGEPGQTVEYEMVVKNTGNIPVTLGALADPQCDAGTIAGGPGASPLAIGASTTFTCTHLLNTTDQAAGSYANTASDTATPVGEGSPVTETSNTVLVEVPGGGVLPETPIEKTPEKSNGNSSSPGSGVLASSTASSPTSGLNGASPKSAVLASKAAIPALSGPHGCVRAAFRASVKSAGVKSVGFYMDKRKLKSMTARSARKGRLTITIDPTRLSIGAHRLTAQITMVPTSSGAKARHATRAMTVLRCSSAVLTPHFTG
jgi:hypothetical protein